MSVWRMTTAIPGTDREGQMVAVLPEGRAAGDAPVDAVLMLSDRSREADVFLRQLPLERELCAERGLAACCLPGWIMDCPEAERLVFQTLPRWLGALYPVRLTMVCGQGDAEAWLREHLPPESGWTVFSGL